MTAFRLTMHQKRLTAGLRPHGAPPRPAGKVHNVIHVSDALMSLSVHRNIKRCQHNELFMVFLCRHCHIRHTIFGHVRRPCHCRDTSVHNAPVMSVLLVLDQVWSKILALVLGTEVLVLLVKSLKMSCQVMLFHSNLTSTSL